MNLAMLLSMLTAAALLAVVVSLVRRVRWAEKDPVTGLPVRARWEAQAGRLLARGKVEALQVIDVDGMKMINERHGHLAGDQVLAALAARLRDAYGRHALIARLGGDEFLIASRHGAPVYTSRTLGERLCGSVVTLASGADVQVSVSVGAAITGRERDLRALVETADRAMFEQKATRRPRYQPSWLEKTEGLRTIGGRTR